MTTTRYDGRGNPIGRRKILAGAAATSTASNE